jgi:hypothetical protein
MERRPKLHAGEGMRVRFEHGEDAVGDMPELSQQQ